MSSISLDYGFWTQAKSTANTMAAECKEYEFFNKHSNQNEDEILPSW